MLFPYKFEIIPVELLSNIYEAFLKVEEQAKTGVYYTPPLLADLVLDETLSQKLKNNTTPSCIDFTCGSGIFLVKAFERIVKKNNCGSDFEKKKMILKKCIFGVEKDPVAARIAVFSFILKDDKYLNAESFISNTMGTGIFFVLSTIHEKREAIEIKEVLNIKDFILLTTEQKLKPSQNSSLLKQDKIKIYNKKQFAIVKSNQFRDWSEIEAIKDAKEEIELFIKQLPK